MSDHRHADLWHQRRGLRSHRIVGPAARAPAHDGRALTNLALPFRGGQRDLPACWLSRSGWGPSALRKADGPHPNHSPEGEGLMGLRLPPPRGMTAAWGVCYTKVDPTPITLASRWHTVQQERPRLPRFQNC